MSSYVYGSKVNSKWRAFIAYDVTTNNDTTYAVTVSAGLDTDGSGYSSSNASCTLSGTGGTTYSVTNQKASGRLHVMISSKTYTWTKGKSSASKTITAVTKTSGGTVAPGTSTATLSVTVPAKTSYIVSYSANGGSSTPSSQTKWYGEALTLASAISRTGYTFSGWKATNGTVYQAGGSYTANSATTMTAQWTANTVQITYDANGGVGSIASQTKTYNQTLTLSDGTGFTRQNYSITGWNTSADGTGTAYAKNEELTATFLTPLTLYAQWHLDYIAPTISNFDTYRVASSSSTTETDDGTYIYIAFDYKAGTADSGTTWETPSYDIEIDGTSVASGTLTIDANGEGTFTGAYGTYSADTAHTVEVTINDTYGVDVTATGSISTATYPIDLIGSGTDVYMGIMTPAVNGQELTIKGHNVDGNVEATGNVKGSQLYKGTYKVPTIYIQTTAPTSADGENGDIWLVYTP